MIAPRVAVAADRSVGGQGRPFYGWRIVAAFAVTQTVGYGVLSYAFSVLLRPVAADLNASTTAVTGAFTIAILTWAAAAIPVGRFLDRHGGRTLMTLGAAGGAAMLVAWSQVQTIGQLYLVFVGLGIAMASALYEPATAVIVSWFDARRRASALLAMIVVAGFASTIFMPLTGLLESRYGWRTTLLVLAAVYASIAVPIHAIVVRRPPVLASRADGKSGRPPALERRLAVRAALHDGRFWCLAVAFVAHAAAMSTMSVHLVSFLTNRGHPATLAASVAGLLGVLSVTGRVLLTGAQRRIRLVTAVAVIYVVQAVAALSLLAFASSAAGAVAGVVAFGIGFGVASLAAPALLADRYGTTAYASIAGTLAAPVTVAKATAPLAAAALFNATGNYLAVLGSIAVACLLAAVGIGARARTPAPLVQHEGDRRTRVPEGAQGSVSSSG